MRMRISGLLVILIGLLCSTMVYAENIFEVKAGTPVEVRFVEDVSGETHHTGERIMLVVNRDVKVKEKVVIKAGAPVVAEIRKAKKKRMAGQAGELLFSFKYVEAVDGQNIFLSGSRDTEGEDKMVQSIGLGLVCCPLFLLSKGEEAIIKSGTTTLVYTVSPVKVKVE